MKNIGQSSDTFAFSRWLFIPYIKRILSLSRTTPTQNPEFSRSRFEPYRPIQYRDPPFVNLPKSTSKKEALYLLLALIKAHKVQILIGFLTCLLWTVFNTLTPKVVKQFFRLMNDATLEGSEIVEANYLTQKFIALQLLRIITSANTKRLFGQLSVKVTGALSIELVSKALRLSQDCRQLLPESEIYQIENTDMKAVSHLFKELWIITDVPFTIIASIVLLFSESISFGIVGLYWIFLIFFLQRWLTELMAQSLNRKLRLTEKRSRVNYETMDKMPQARLGFSEDYFVEKNNDFFLLELAEYKKCHRLLTIFDISLVILPLVFVISLSFYDQHEAASFTIEEVYILMTLIGLCYKPFKNLRKFTLTFSEALYSLNRFSIYLDLPEKVQSSLIRNNETLIPKLKVSANTMTFTIAGNKKNTGFFFQRDISVKAGERLYVLGKRGQGVSQFLKSILGQLELVRGQINLEGSFAYLPRENFFTTESVKENISFYDSNISSEQIKAVYHILDLDEDLSMRGGLDEKVRMDSFSEIQLKKIGIARVLLSKRKVIVLDCPFLGLPVSTAEKIDAILRERQADGSIVIIAERYLQFAENYDRVVLVEKGQIKEQGTFQFLSQGSDSQVHHYEQTSRMALSDKISCLNIVKEFQRKITKIVRINEFIEDSDRRVEERQKKIDQLCHIVGKYSLKLKEKEEIRHRLLKKQQKKSFSVYAKKVLSYLPWGDWALAIFLILTIELLNIFVQFQFGSQYKHGGKTKLSTLREIMKYEIALTLCLALFIFLLRQIQFCISSIIANHVYKDSITAIIRKKMSYFYKSHSSLLAHKYNHDYDQIFTSVHFIFEIIKFTVVLVSTIISINASAGTVISLSLVTSVIYYSLLKFYRRAEDSLIRSYPHYKYEFVKVFDQIIEGAHMINIFGKREEAISKAKQGFNNVAAFKLTSDTIQICEEVLCEVTGTIIISLGLEYGTKMKLKEGDHNEALVAVSVMLLLNLSDVLKTILKTILKLEAYFRLKLFSYIEIINIEPPEIREYNKKPLRHSIQFKQRWLQDPENPIFELYPLTLKIGDYEKILLVEKDPIVRTNMLMALTNNLVDPSEENKRSCVDVITIGRELITHLSKEDLMDLIGILLPENFYFTGTLDQNLKWKMTHYQPRKAARLAEAMNISKEVPDFDRHGLQTVVNGQEKNKSLSRKIAMLRILLRKPNIVIIKDTPWVVGSKDVLKWLREADIHCIVIGISESPTGIRNQDRFVLLQKGKILEDGRVQDLKADPMSQSGQLLRLSENESADLWRAEKEENPLVIKQKRRELMKAIIDTYLSKGTL